MGSQHTSPNAAAPRPKLVTTEKSYRLFPTANQQPQISPRTLSKRTLKRTGSLLKRRSASLDEPLRAHRVARQPFSRPEDAPVPRLQPAPSTRGKFTKPSVQDRDASSHFRHPRARTDRLEPHDQQTRLYMPRVSEDGGHGRSSSAPDNMAIGQRVKKLTGLSHVTNASLSNSAKVAPSHGGTWYNARDSTVPTTSHRESKKSKVAKPGPFTEKPLPPPPPKEAESRTYLDAVHQRSHSTPLSPGPRSQFYLAPRSDSATELTPLKMPSCLDPNRKSYFPLSADAQMRELMGIGPIEDGETSSVPPIPPMPILDSKFQKSAGLPTITVDTDVKSTEVNEISPTSDPTGPASAAEDLQRPAMHSPTFSQASSRMMPAALRIVSPKRSVSARSASERPPLAPKANENQLVQHPAKAIAIEDDIEMAMSTWAELTAQTTTLHARYATLREDRQFILGAMTLTLREKRPGPDYANTMLDQQMSLTMCCSSMDICLAKLKAVDRRKDVLAKTLATHALLNTPTWGLAEQQPALKTSPTTSTSATSNKSAHQSASSSTQAHDAAPSRGSNKPQHLTVTQNIQSRFDSESDTDDGGAPRRMNLKGVKAARILGLNLDGTIPEELPRVSSTRRPNHGTITEKLSRVSSTRRPTHTLQTNLSTTSLDREQFTRAPIPSSNHNNNNTLPLPSSAPIRHDQSDFAPSWRSIDSPTIHNVSHTTQDYVDASTSSSRASSPVDERGAETPDVAYAASTFDDPKSPGMQTVHVYFPESTSLSASFRASATLSEAGEDELLEYYGCYR
jgi:hypothetical protein